MIEMLILLNGCITVFSYEVYYKDFYIKFINGAYGFLRDESNRSLRDYLKNKITYI